MAEEWSEWFEHDGKGMPCAPHEIVWTVDRSGDEYISRADDEMNVCSEGSSWVWTGDFDPTGCDIIRYRIRRPRGLTILQELIEKLPETVEA